jgi:hypothetical protein
MTGAEALEATCGLADRSLQLDEVGATGAIAAPGLQLLRRTRTPSFCRLSQSSSLTHPPKHVWTVVFVFAVATTFFLP